MLEKVRSRVIRAARGTQLSARSWTTEAPLRMLMNNLDPQVAENPSELVVYGGIGRAARDWNCYDRIVETLKVLTEEQTLLVQSGKPVGVFPTHADAPRVLIANSNLVPHWATWEHFHELDRKGLAMFGQMTAGSWIYIGSQGIVQGTYETFAEMGRRHFGDNLAGKWILTAGLGGMGGAQPLAATMAGAHMLAEMTASHLGKGLIGTLDDALAADVDPGSGGHLSEHRETLAIEFVKVLPGGPMRHEVRIRDQHARRVRVRREYADGFAGLHEQCLLFGQDFERLDDAVVAIPVARGASDAAVNDEFTGIFGNLRVEVVHEHPQRRFGRPTARGKLRAARCADDSRSDFFQHGYTSLRAKTPGHFIARAGVIELGHRRDRTSGPGAPIDEEAGLIAFHIEQLARALIGHDRAQHVLGLLKRSDFDQIVMRRRAPEIHLEVVRCKPRRDVALLELHGSIVLVVHDRGKK